MFKEIIQFLRDYLNGREAEIDIDVEIEFTWWEVGAILTIIGLAIYLIVR